MDTDRINIPADPGGALLFIFSMEVISFWATYLGSFGEGTYLILGCLMLAVYPVYLIGAVLYYKRDDAYMGNCYLIFGSLFGGIFGLVYIALHFGMLFNWNMNISILALPMFWGSLAVFAMLKTYGLELLAVGMPFIYTIDQWLSLIVGIGTAYLFINDLLVSGGSKGLPMGPTVG